MPVVNGVGQSEQTQRKERLLGAILGQNLSICREIFRRDYAPPCYLYYDLYAGCGYNEVAQCDGSPLVFLSVAQRLKMPYIAHCIEISPQNAEALRQRIGERANVVEADNADVLLTILKATATYRYSFGMIYADPNGIPPFGLLAEVSKERQAKRIDILVYMSASNLKRVRKVHQRDPLLEELRTIQKSTWLVSTPERHDQWAFLLGTNYDGYPRYVSIGLHRLDSPQGQEIMDKLNWTEQEREERNSPTFFTPATLNISASPHSGPSEGR